jgi:hypothetical protein
MAQVLQHDLTALISELPAAYTAGSRVGRAPSGLERRNAVVSVLLV